MRQRYKKAGAVVNIAGGVQVVKVYVVNHFPDATKMVVSLTTTQWLSLVGLVVFGAVAGIKAFVLP